MMSFFGFWRVFGTIPINCFSLILPPMPKRKKAKKPEKKKKTKSAAKSFFAPKPRPKKNFFQSNLFAVLFVVVFVGLFIGFADKFRDSLPSPAAKPPAVKTVVSKPVIGMVAPVEEKVVQEAPVSMQSYFVNFQFLNIRESIGLNAAIVKVLDRDDQLLAQPTDNPEWVKVVLDDGTHGFAAKRYLTPLSKDLATQRGLLDIPILMYHYVDLPPITADEMRKKLTVTPAALWQQLQYLEQSGVRTLTLEHIAKAARDGVALPEKAAVLTFDDGYENHYTNVFPLLKKLNQKAVFFVIIDRIGTPGFMTWDQIKEMKDAGMEIGSHAKGDVDLRFVTEKEGFNQIGDSKKILEEKLGSNIYSFAYPSGHYSSWLFKVLSRSGYAFARTTEGGRYLDIEKHPYTLPVLRILPTTTPENLKNWGI